MAINYSVRVFKAGVFGRRPCPDAEVTLTHASGRRRRLKTDSQGYAHFRNIDSGSYQIHVEPPEPWAPVTRSVYIRRSSYINITLGKLPVEQRRKVEWKVLVKAQGQFGGGPIPNARVVLRGEGQRYEETTNEEGLATFRGIPTGEYYLEVFPPDPWKESGTIPVEISGSGSSTVWLERKPEIWYVVVGDGTYFCKSRDKSKAEEALEYYKSRYPDVSWSLKEGTIDELGALPSTDCQEILERKEEEEKAAEGYITLARNPFYGEIMYNPDLEAYIFRDYQTMQTRMVKPEDFLNLGIENPDRWMEDINTVCRTCKENKERVGLLDIEFWEILEAAAKKILIPGTPQWLFYISGPAIFGFARSGLNKLAEAGVIELKEVDFTGWDSKDVAMTMLENAAYALAAYGFTGVWSSIGSKLGLAKDAFFTTLWIGGFVPFIAEEAAQALGMAVFIARQVRDPDLLEDAINRYEQIVITGKELTDKFGWLNPFTYETFKLFFQAAQDSLEIYRKLPDKIREEKEKEEEEKKAWEEYREERKKFHEDFKAYWEERKKQWEEFMDYWEERKRSWEAFMERDVEKTLSIMINTVTDCLRAIYFGMRTGVETIIVLKRMLREITEETARARIEKMIEEAQKRIQDISANYDEIVQRGLEYASQIEDETMRASYESYILTLREQIEMELMRAEAEEIPILEGIFKKGYLFVIGYPRYCRIYLNGEDTGKLAPERFVLDPGKYVVKVVRETGEEWEKEVEVKEGETTEVIYWIPRSA